MGMDCLELTGRPRIDDGGVRQAHKNLHPRGANIGYHRGRRKESKPSPTESPLWFEGDPEPACEVLTAFGGIPRVVQAFGSLGVPASAKQPVQIKERQRGYDEATFVGMGATRVRPAGWEADEKEERTRRRRLKEPGGWCRQSSESSRRKRGHARQSSDLESGAKTHRPKPRVSEPLTPTEAITTLNRDSWESARPLYLS